MTEPPHLPEPDLLQKTTARGARRIFLRFVLVAVGVNAMIGAAVVIFNVYDSLRDTHDRLETIGEMHLRTVRRLREAAAATDEAVVRQAARLINVPLALLDKGGRVRIATDDAIPAALERVYGGPARQGTEVRIAQELGQLSGAWVVGALSDRHDLLVIVTRTPEDEGLAIYMTIAAGLTGLAIAISFFIMLAAANWMLRRPLSRLVTQLTGALARDVERRREAEERAVHAREEAEKHLAFMNSLIDASEAVGIVGMDDDGVIQIFNWGAVRILGHGVNEVVGKMTIDQLRGTVQAGGDQRSPLMHPREGEEFWVDKAGNELLLYVNRNPILDGVGKVRGQLVTFIDVTERRRLEAELQLNELQLIQSAKLATLGEMATGIAHELNQPLNNIGLLTSRLLRRLGGQPLDPEERAFSEDKLTKVQAQVERAGKIIDHLRTFGRPTARQLASVAVNEPVDGVMVFLREQLVRHGIKVTVDVADNLPRARADESRLEQVLMNLILNARDALDEREGDEPEKEILIRARPVTLPGGEPGVSIEITDNGPGIPREVVDRVFEPFFTTKEVGKGTGLGLSISYGLVREFGGTLEVQSRPGEGSSFTVLLKAALAADDPSTGNEIDA